MDKLMKYDVLQNYKQVLMDTLKGSFPLLSERELSDAIDYSMNKRLNNPNLTLNNNYTNVKVNSNVLDVTQYIASMEPIVTSSGVLFKKHKDSTNLLTDMIRKFVDLRDEYKHEMFKYPRGSEMFEKYNLYQLLCKLDSNAVYGAMGQCTCLFYNIYVAEAVTRQGRSSISCSLLLFEAFLGNNVKFNSLDETITFIHNVVGERDKREFNDHVILQRDVTLAEAFYKVMSNADPTIWIPNEKEMSLVWEYMQTLTQEDLNRIFYKNNLYSFAEEPVILELLKKILCELKTPFMSPNDPPEYIKPDLDLFVKLCKEYVYYRYFPIDKLDRIEYMQRDIVIITDTDSTIISFDAWYRFLLSKVYDIDMPIKHKTYDMISIIKTDEFGDKIDEDGNEIHGIEMVEDVEPEYDYDFYTDEYVEKQRLINPCVMVPQDALKYSIINIMAYVCGKLIVDYLDAYSDLNHSNQPGKKCELIMKNEFYFLRALLTPNRRNYADLQLLQEGNIVPEKERMAIMGLPINKSTLSKQVKKKLQKILYEEILNSHDIDQIKIMKKLAAIEKEIYDNIMAGKTDYYKPDNIGSISSYTKKDPLQVNGILAATIYNELRSEDMPAINLEERNSIIKVKIIVDRPRLERIKDTFPEIYAKMNKLLAHPVLGKKLTVIGFPLDAKIPEWVLEFVDVKTIINDIIKNFPVKSIGLERLGNDSVNYSNIIKL